MLSLRYGPVLTSVVFPCGSAGKESACNVGDLGLIPGLGRSPGGGHGNPLQYSGQESPHGQRSLVGYSPWGLEESDMTVTKHRTAEETLLPIKLEDVTEFQLNYLKS